MRRRKRKTYWVVIAQPHKEVKTNQLGWMYPDGELTKAAKCLEKGCTLARVDVSEEDISYVLEGVNLFKNVYFQAKKGKLETIQI